DCTLTDDAATNGDGGGIFNFGMLTVTDCTLAYDSAAGTNAGSSGSGGGNSNFGRVAVRGTNHRHPYATGRGRGTLNFDRGRAARVGAGSVVEEGGGRGGAIFNSSGPQGAPTKLTVTNCTLTDDSASFGDGGGIFIDVFVTATVSGCTLANDSAGIGGGIFN